MEPDQIEVPGIPATEQATEQSKPLDSGVTTTEYKAMKGGTIAGYVALILGVIGAFGPDLTTAVGAETTAGKIIGGIISIGGILTIVLSKLGYIQQRTALKQSALIDQKVLDDDALAK